MSSITNGVGLVSGLPISNLVNGLISVQQRPILQLQGRMSVFAGRRTGLLQVSAQLLSIKNAVSQFALPTFFNSATATSSNASAIQATASAGAAIGDYSLTVRSLAMKHHLVSSGFATSNQTPVGAGTLTIESALGQVNRSTRLATLNGGQGVQTGRIRVTDRAGGSATVDLVGAQTINDVIDRINAASGVQVTARANGDRLVLEDASGGAGSLSVTEVGAGRTAADLGLLKSIAGNTLEGDRLVYISGTTRLSDLNDGNGVRRLNAANDLQLTLGDGSTLGFNLSDSLLQTTPLSLLNGGNGVPSGRFRITNRAGVSAEIDLAGAVNVQDVMNRVSAANIGVTLTVSGSRFSLVDSSLSSGQTAQGNLKVENIEGGAAAALGIVGSTTTNTLQGGNVYSVRTMADVLRVINHSPQNINSDGSQRVTAAVSSDGLGITLTDQTAGGGPLLVSESNLARDLGLSASPVGYNGPPVSSVTSKPLIAGLNTVLLKSLNGGGGVNLSDLRIGDRTGGPLVSIGLAGAATLDDVIQAINASGVGVHAEVSASGLGIDVTDTTGGAGQLRIEGVTADLLGIAGNAAGATIRGGNLQRQYVSEATRRADFNNGAGIPSGRFRITDSLGASAVVDLTGGEETLREIIAEINSRGIGVVARINDSGDGLLLTDTAGGGGKLKVVEEGGSVAKALGILGEAEQGRNYIDGSLEKRIEVDGNDTLADVLEKIRTSGAAVNASIINDGSGGQAFRLNLVSSRSGLVGGLAIDGGATGLSFNALAQARDAVVLLGEADADQPLVITSSSNSLDGVIAGVKLELIAPSEQAILISVRQDQDKIVQQAQSFVDAFNNLITTLDNLTRFDSETNDRGILQGDATARRVRQTLSGLSLASVPGLSGGLSRLSGVGIKIGSTGKLDFDETKFRAAMIESPDAVKDLFALEEVDGDGKKKVIGLSGIIQREIDRLIDTENGVITLQETALQNSESQINRRIQQMTALLESKRQRLLADFQAMESVLANMQSQQSALSVLAAQISSFG